MNGIGNIGLLEETGKKDVCIISWQLNDEKQTEELRRALEQHGFRVCFAGETDGLMRRFVRLKLSERLTPRQRFARALKYLALAARRKLRSGRLGRRSDVLYLLVSCARTGDGWIHEAVQVRFEELGARDRLFWYDAQAGRIMKYERPVLGYLEYDVANHCNLKCKGCSHYSNLVREPEFADPDRFRKNLARMKELFDHVEVIRLLGGEPFLNPDLGDFVTAAREAYPDAVLSVVSNGLLIPKNVKDEVLEAIRRNNARIRVSNYPPTVKLGGEIRRRLEESGVRYSSSRPVTKFQFETGSEAGDGRKNYNHCALIQDHLLSDDGRMCLCDNPVLYDENRERLKTKREVSEKDWINICRMQDGCEVLRKLHQPVPFCRYCLTRKKIMFPWKGNYLKELTRETVHN